jgi:hypothetical protein
MLIMSKDMASIPRRALLRLFRFAFSAHFFAAFAVRKRNGVERVTYLSIFSGSFCSLFDLTPFLVHSPNSTADVDQKRNLNFLKQLLPQDRELFLAAKSDFSVAIM